MKQLSAALVFAVAGYLNFFAACRFTIIAAVLLTFGNNTRARLVRALMGLFICNDDSPRPLGCPV